MNWEDTNPDVAPVVERKVSGEVVSHVVLLEEYIMRIQMENRAGRLVS